MFSSPFAESIVARAAAKGSITLKIHDLRNWSDDNYQSVDDHPYGGGAGMVMKIGPIYKAIKEIRSSFTPNSATRVLVMSAKGEKYTEQTASELSKIDNLIILCGHYEGIDERVITDLADAEISIGDYVLSGGELPAMVIVDSIARLLPGVLGNAESLASESHNEAGVLEYPQYTKPAVFITDEGKELKVPDVLLSGDHKKIADWRLSKQK